MNLAKVQPGDEIDCNVKGRLFRARVEEKLEDGTLRIAPPSGITYFRVTARQVTKRHPQPKTTT